MAIVPGSDQKGRAPEAALETRLMPGFAGFNQPEAISLRRSLTYDNPIRLATQLLTNRGVYSRAPVGPVEYTEGNIKKSAYLTGLPGYNQRNVPIPDSPDDMSQADYLASLQQMSPQAVTQVQSAIMNPSQNFLSAQSMPGDFPSMSHNMPNSLLSLAHQIKKSKR